ncbi:protein DEHYDRATION-INDUCED 19 homolog 5-like [Telopea speciosissima]|uniref:protein DEHYDRATION-INDUCED 19 homolog 5-like n=1 Tax=Telopea speciosissima TaxID=54955 RepID=UPI001CC68687|nr:protein DEHYDRATION-INDUCED 19 homolog 5-like [Telopea speciosissima]
MDVDFWTSRVQSANHLTAMQAARLNFENHLSLDDYEGDDDIRACFPCPFCYVEIEVPVLCAHLQEEHCFDVKNAVCPLCAANLGKDMIGHFTLQHAHMLKRRKPQRSGLWTSSSSMLGKELQELNAFLGATSTIGRGSATDSTPDPLLSPFLCSIVLSDTKDGQDTHSKNDLPASSDIKSMEPPSTSDDAPEQDYRERNQRAEFFQQLILSTIF